MYLEVYSKNYRHLNRIEVTKTVEGWDFQSIRRGGKCYKNGELLENHEPGESSLFDILDNLGGPEVISYPSLLGLYMEMLWDRAETLVMKDDEIQKNLDVLSEWIQKVEDGKPNDWEDTGYGNLNPSDASKYS